VNGKKVLRLLEDFTEPAPEGDELEAFLAAPKHHLARLIRDLFSDEAAGTTMEVAFPFGTCLLRISEIISKLE
jgi:hypothetical protein